MATTREKLMTMKINDDLPSSKISIVGVGQVGMACAFAMMCQVSF